MTSPEKYADGTLLDVAGAVLDGVQVDWAAADSSAPTGHRSRLRQLQKLARVVSGHKDSQLSDPATGGDFAAIGDDTEGTTWGHLEIHERIGEGAFGEVYRARDQRLDRQIALKLFRPHRLSSSPLTSEVIEEGRLLARVRHPNVVTVHGAEYLDGRVGIWMEFIEGATLEEIVANKGPMSTTEAMLIAQDLCRALSALHAAGVIHRDIKARNVMREESGRVVLMDLGISCEIDRDVPIAQYGTPLYAAPEVLLAGESSRQGDIYSLGVLLYFLVSGQYPVTGSTLAEISEAHEAGRYRQLKELRPDLAESLVTIVDKALAPKRGERFANAIDLERALSDELAAETYTQDQQAYNRYLQGRHFWNRRFRGGLPKAIEFFRKAVARDPDFALAHVGVADSVNLLSYYQYIRPRDGFPEARAAAEKALELDPDLGEAHASLGWISMYYDWDYGASARHFQRAIELRPRYVSARQWYGLLLSAMGKHDEALAEVRAGRELDPTSLVGASEATVLLTAGRLEEALETFRLTLETDPESVIHNAHVGTILCLQGKMEDGIAYLQKAAEYSMREDSYMLSLLALGFALFGREAEAFEVIAQLDALAQKRYVSYWHRAIPWLFLGRYDKWGPLLEKAIEERDPFLVWIRHTIAFEKPRNDPRFVEPLRRAGLLD